MIKSEGITGNVESAWMRSKDELKRMLWNDKVRRIIVIKREA
jgi:hypothetical protein